MNSVNENSSGKLNRLVRHKHKWNLLDSLIRVVPANYYLTNICNISIKDYITICIYILIIIYQIIGPTQECQHCQVHFSCVIRKDPDQLSVQP